MTTSTDVECLNCGSIWQIHGIIVAVSLLQCPICKLEVPREEEK